MKANENGSVLKSAQALIQAGRYEYRVVEIDETAFHVFGRKEDGLSLSLLETSLRKMWPRFRRHFDHSVSEAAIVDLDAPIGGGPLAPYVIGVFYSPQISREHQQVIREANDWPPQDSTQGYIAQAYSGFSDSKEAYVDDILVHEFGHLYFGWGQTRVDESNPNDWWFSFGMGLLYDRIAWDEVYHAPSPLFENVIRKWTDDFSKRKEIDQRLINPDTSGDGRIGLQRLQTYGHGKAYKFLQAARGKIGAEKFDQKMNEFLFSDQIPTSDYNRFLQGFNTDDLSGIAVVERDFAIK